MRTSTKLIAATAVVLLAGTVIAGNTWMTSGILVREGTKVLVLDEEGYLLEVLEPGPRLAENPMNTTVVYDNQLGGMREQIDAFVSYDGAKIPVQAALQVTININDTLDYLKAHPDIKLYAGQNPQSVVGYAIYNDFVSQQVSESDEFALSNDDFTGQYAGEPKPIQFTADGEPSIETDAALGAAFTLEKAASDAAKAEIAAQQPVEPTVEEEQTLLPKIAPPTEPPTLADAEPRDSALWAAATMPPPVSNNSNTSPFDAFRDKYEFRCWVLEVSFDSQPLLEAFVKDEGLSSYESLELSMTDRTAIIRDTELPCGLIPTTPENNRTPPAPEPMAPTPDNPETGYVPFPPTPVKEPSAPTKKG